ncbi:hypothetical protein ACXEO8_13030 [Cytobacillus firmus]|uniref:hypothetical protein n=1 Tax=Bacillus sp. 22-7 TaxID=2709707 RepID=UPI0013D11D01|nr:hypothetical protein [Bacillus sp. 22-7]
MYGEIEVNDYHLLKYSLLYDFYCCFSSLEIFDLPLVQCLGGQFLSHIQQFVDQNRLNPKLISKLRKEKKFVSMGEINKKLLTFDNISTKELNINKNSILLADDYYNFAADQLREYEVTIYGTIQKEFHADLPKHIKSYLFKDEIRNMDRQVINQQKKILKTRVEYALKNAPKHYYFSKKSFKQWFPRACMSIIGWVYVLDQLILKTAPAVIIDPVEASIFGTILGLLSKKYRIPYVNMPIVLIGDRSMIPSRADYYFVWGKNQKNWLIKRNIKPDKIIETGNLKFFYEMKSHSSSKESFNENLNIPANHLILGFTSQPFLYTNDQIEEWIRAIPTNYPITILLKKHRTDQYEYPLLVKKANVKILPLDYPLYDFLAQIDCLMTISSNTGIEAALFNKPLLILQPNIPYHYSLSHNQINAHLAKAQAGEVINNERDFIQIVRKLLTQKNYINQLIKQGNIFLSETISTVDQSPVLVKNQIKKIILKGL